MYRIIKGSYFGDRVIYKVQMQYGTFFPRWTTLATYYSPWAAEAQVKEMIEFDKRQGIES